MEAVSTGVVPGKHLPDCPSQQPAPVVVEGDELRVMLTFCTGCLPIGRYMEPVFDRMRTGLMESMAKLEASIEEWKP